MRTSFVVACALAFGGACGGGGSQNNSPDASPGGGSGSNHNQAVCGDGVCNSDEINSCPQDCGAPPVDAGVSSSCGDFVCDPTKGETAQSCPQDCGAGSGGSGGSGTTGDCSDPTFLIECIIDPTTPGCDVCLGGGGGFGDALCDGGAADGVCEPDEDSSICPSDCP